MIFAYGQEKDQHHKTDIYNTYSNILAGQDCSMGTDMEPTVSAAQFLAVLDHKHWQQAT